MQDQAIKTDLYKYLLAQKEYLQITETLNAQGEVTTKPGEICCYSVNLFHVDQKHHHGFPLMIGLTISEIDNDTQLIISQIQPPPTAHLAKQLEKFKVDLKKWAVNNNIVWNAPKIFGKAPLQESNFKAIEAKTGKISVQRLGDTKLYIRHRDIINDSVPGARSRRIQQIWIINPRREKFLLPTTNLRAARALAHHVNQGGTPYDTLGQTIISLATECVQLAKFLKKTRTFDEPQHHELVPDIANRVETLRNQLAKMTRSAGYQAEIATLDTDRYSSNPEIPEIYQHLSQDPAYADSLPWVGRVANMSKLPELREFEQWSQDVVAEQITDPKLAAVEKMITGPKKPEKKGITVQKTAKGTVAINVPKDDPEASKQAAKFFGSGGAKKLPPGTSISVIETVGGDKADDLFDDTVVSDVEEGNEFTGARQAAIKAGEDTFQVGDKTFKVTGNTSDSITESLDRIITLSNIKK